MKKRLYFLFAAGIFFCFGGCVAEDQVEPVPETCTNGVMDAGEQDIDCGNLCEPCANLAAPCQAPDDKIILYDGTGTWCFPVRDTIDIAFRDTSPSSGGEFVQIRFYLMNHTSGMNGSGSLFLYGGWPQWDCVYYLDNTYWGSAPYVPAPYGKGTMDIGYSLCGTATSSSGKLYADKQPDGSVIFTFCDLQFYYLDQNYLPQPAYDHGKGRFHFAP